MRCVLSGSSSGEGNTIRYWAILLQLPILTRCRCNWSIPEGIQRSPRISDTASIQIDPTTTSLMQKRIAYRATLLISHHSQPPHPPQNQTPKECHTNQRSEKRKGNSPSLNLPPNPLQPHLRHTLQTSFLQPLQIPQKTSHGHCFQCINSNSDWS
jgi:hypothetical protein